MTVNIGNASPGTELLWDSAYFSPSSLVLQASSAQAGSSLNFTNRIDLNGGNRTIAMNGTALGVTATVSGVIRNSAGTPAGLTKTGPGLLILTAANTYNGGTTVNQGTLRFGSLTSMPAVGEVAVQNGAILRVDVGGSGEWTTGTSGYGTIGGLLSGLGGQSGGTVSYFGNVTLDFETTGTLDYTGNIGNVGTSLAITKSGGSALTLSGTNSYSGKTSVLAGTLAFSSIGNVGGGANSLGSPATISSGTIDVGYRNVAGTLRYTGSGHTSDRVINLASTTGGVILDSSGSGPWILTSACTATGVGAKTLTLTGTNTAANSLASSAIPSMTDVLTIQKSGTGTWWIQGFSSPKNAWSVTAGTLVIAGTITTGDQQVTVSGGTLAGVGPITLQSGKTLTVQAAGSLAPGNLAVGTLALTGNLNLSAMASGTGKLNFQIGAPASSDKITVTGTAQIGSGVLGFNDFVFTDLGGMTANTYILISTTGGFTGTLDPANLSGTIGAINGTLQINGNNLEFTVDSDGDGIPDSWMIEYFGHPTGLESDLSRAGDDAEGDGLTNLQEYQRGTLPKNPDTDADGLADGVETKTGVWVSATNTGTDPLKFDTDGDTIRDGHETNTGNFLSSTNTGTNPNLADTDADGFSDNVETHTGTFVSKTNTGTNPNNPDTDGDGAGDWYEITASFTSPFLPGEKPSIPYPLPDPDSSTGATNKPVKVYIMSGQSNMVGFGAVSGTGDGTLETMTMRQNKFPDLINGSGGWTTRQDVRYRGVISDFAKVQLSPGTLGSTFGPELGFGYIMGWHHDEPVLLLKSCTGNRALGWDVLPPGSPSYQYDGYQYAGYGQTPNKWLIGTTPTPIGWYAGKEFDRFFTHESEWAHPDPAETNVVDVLDNFATEYPDWASQGFEIAGFVWWQGDKDRYDMGLATRYEQNLVNLINSLRNYYTNRYPGKVVANAPFVLATLGQTAIGDTSSAADKAILDAQLAVDGNAGKYAQFSGNVKTVYAHPLSEGGASNGHYNGRAGTYLLVGDALGRAMVSLESATPPASDYQTWAAVYSGKDLKNPTADLDGDGHTNNQERIWGLDPTSGASSNPISIPYNATTGTLTYTRRNQALNPETTFRYEWSGTLVDGSWQEFTPFDIAANGASPVESVTITLPVELLGNTKRFVRVVASN